MRKTAYRYSCTHRLPADELGKLRDHRLKRDALQSGTGYRFFICVHACILQMIATTEGLHCRDNRI
jgi:hypothetical protein